MTDVNLMIVRVSLGDRLRAGPGPFKLNYRRGRSAAHWTWTGRECRGRHGPRTRVRVIWDTESCDGRAGAAV